jgi:hypothetical protein
MSERIEAGLLQLYESNEQGLINLISQHLKLHPIAVLFYWM